MNPRTLSPSHVTTAIVLILASVGLLLPSTPASADPHNKKIDCDKNQSLSHAVLTADQLPMTIYVKGTCNENLFIDRHDLTLIADPVATINGPDPAQNTVTVVGERVTIKGFRVTGGRQGIAVVGGHRVTIDSCTVENTGRNGIFFFQGGNGTVTGSAVRNNPRHGILIESASATIIGSTITNNTSTGITVSNGGGARIGINNRLESQGNNISNNVNDGIHVVGATAYIHGNTITGNGTSAAPGFGFGRNGIGVYHGTAIVIGENRIDQNMDAGIFATRNSGVFVGDPNFGLPSANTISNNGTASTISERGGVVAFLNSSVDIRDATITGNARAGVLARLRSSARMFNTTATPNAPAEIRAELGGALFFVGGVAGGAVTCTDLESSSAPSLGTCSGF